MPFDWEMLENVKKIVVASFLVSIGFIGAIKTYHLKEAQYHEGPLFLRPHCGQTSEHTSYSKVLNERYVHYLSNDTT